jgi:hypothetical protein
MDDEAERVTCMNLRTNVVGYPALIKKSDAVPAK